MFEKGDMVFYKNIGVCVVDDITSLPFAMDVDQKYYVMRSLYKNGVNYVPLDGELENIRNIISKEEAEGLINKIPEIEAQAILDLPIKELTDFYDEKINSGDPESILELLLSISKKKDYLFDEKKKFGAIDDNYLKKATDMLSEEFAAALDIEKDQVSDYVEDKVGFRIS